MDIYVWYNNMQSKYEIGSRVDFEMIIRRKSFDDKPELLYRFNRLSSKLAEKVVKELNTELELKTA